MDSQILRNIGTLIIFGFIFVILVIVLKLNLKKILYKATDRSFTFVGNTLLKVHNKNIQKTQISNKKSFANGKLYKTINQMIFDLGLDDVTVEGFLFMLIVASLIVGFVTVVLTKSILFFIFTTVGSCILLYTLAYMSASEGHFKREFAIMDAIDIIIVNMQGGVFKAVKEQIGLLDPCVREDFNAFLDDVYEYKIPIEEALDLLGNRLGPGFYRFKEKAKEFESKGRAGMLETFADDMNENMYRRMDLRELLDTLREANMGFFLAVGICGLFAVAFIGGNDYLRNAIFLTTIGRVILIINILAVIIGFAYLQSLRKDKKEEKK